MSLVEYRWRVERLHKLEDGEQWLPVWGSTSQEVTARALYNNARDERSDVRPVRLVRQVVMHSDWEPVDDGNEDVPS